jgi:hypothetical protein
MQNRHTLAALNGCCLVSVRVLSNRGLRSRKYEFSASFSVLGFGLSCSSRCFSKDIGHAPP